MSDLISIIILGIVEGVTEFLPVSSTGHLILAGALLHYDPEYWALFNIVIQLGAILAIVVLYWRTIWTVLVGLAQREAGAWRFVRNLAVAFVPAAVIGLALHKRIEALLGNAQVVAVALIVGGVAILVIERMVKASHIDSVESIGWKTALGIGFVQCLSMIPGVSRSGATIMGALSMGVDRKTAAEYSFFLAVPTMLAASGYDLLKSADTIGSGGWTTIAIGFVVSFLVAIVVIRWFLKIVTRHGFAPFAWYRIVVGSLALVWLMVR